MNYAQYLEKGKTIEESTESLIEKVINSQGLDENALLELVNRAQSQDSKAIEFLLMLQQQSEVSKFEKPSGPIVKKDQQDPNTPVAAETGTVDGRKYTYLPYQGEGPGAPVDSFEYIGADGNIYGMNVTYRGEGLANDTAYVMNGLPYTDPEGQQVILNRQQAVTAKKKCGGRVKKKALGSKITPKKVMAKGKCPCMIKKVGGRLIEVDSCTGLPVHKSGGQVMKFQNPALALTGERNIAKRYLLSDGKYRVNPTTGVMEVNSRGSWLEAQYSNLKNTETFEQLKKLQQQRIDDSKNFINVNGYLVEKPETKGYTEASKKGYYYGNNGAVYKVVNGQWVKLEMTRNDNGSYTNALGENLWLYGDRFITAPSRMGYTQREDGNWYDWNGNQMKITRDGWILAGPSLPQVNEYGQTLGTDGKYSGITYGQRNAAAVGMLGSDGKTGMNVEERQAWMDGAGKDYLAQLNGGKGLGFTSAEYTGTAAQNRALFDAYKGFQNWSDTLAAPVYTNQQLLDLDQAGVAGLSADNKARYDRLQAYQANRNKALTFNGTQYADEQAYNTAVNTANQTAANKYYADLAQQQNIYNGNRAMATAALSSGVQRRRQAAFDNLSALNSGTLDYSKLSHRDIRDMQRQMRRGKRNGLYGNSDEARDFYAAPGIGMLVPTMAKTYAGPAALTQEQLNSDTFTLKRGGILTYSLYLSEI